MPAGEGGDSLPPLVNQDEVVSPGRLSSHFFTSSLTAVGAYLFSWFKPRPNPTTNRYLKSAFSIVGSVALAFGFYALVLTLFQHKLIYMMPRYSHHVQYYTTMLDSIELVMTPATLKKIAAIAGVDPSIVPVLKQPLSWRYGRYLDISTLVHPLTQTNIT